MFSPSLQKNKDTLESIQRRATKSIWDFKLKSYQERLQSLELYQLDNRRLRSDIPMTYNILNTHMHPTKHLLKLSSNTISSGNTQKL